MAATTEQAARLADQYATEQAKLTALLIRILLALWLKLPTFNNPDMVKAWTARTAVDVDITLAQVRRLARAYTITSLELADARPVTLPETVESYERGGTPIVEVYRRPARERAFVERTAIEAGKPVEEAAQEAQDAFETRLQTIVADDVMLTARDESQKVIRSAPKVIGYRRLLHPEFSQTGPCGLCIVAADRLYTVDQLMPIHDNCKCTVSPVTANQDLGLALNKDDLDAIYAAAGGTDASKLTQVRIKTVKHGELGPMLLRSGGKWVDPATVKRRSVRDAARSSATYERQTAQTTQTNWRAMKATSERSIRYLLNAKSRGTNLVDLGTGVTTRVKDLDAAIQMHRDLIARAERHAA